MTDASLVEKIMTLGRFDAARAGWFAAVGIENPFVQRDVGDAGVGMVVGSQGVPAQWFARAIDTGIGESLSAPYAVSAWVRAAIKYVAMPIASVDLVFSRPKTGAVMRRFKGKGQRLYTKDGPVQRQPETEVELPQVRALLKEPVAGLSYEDFVEASIGWKKLQECFWVLGDDAVVPFPEVSQNPFKQLIMARPDRMRPTTEAGKISAWNFTDATGKVWELDPLQVVRYHGWNPYDPVRGLGDYPSAAVAAESHWLGGKFKRNLTGDNDTAPIISSKNGALSDPQTEQIKMSLQERRAARMRGQSKTLFLPGEVDVHDPKILSVDAAFIAGMLEDRHEIFVANGVPPSLADVKASYSIGQASDWFALIFNTCIPEGKKFCGALERLIKTLTGEDIEVALDWDEHYVMQQVRSERMKDADSLFGKGMPVKSISEYLKLNLPQFDGDDVGYLPINIVPVGSSEADTTTDNVDYSETQDKADDAPEGVKAMLRALRCGCSTRNPKLETRNTKSKALWESHMRARLGSVKMFQSKASKLFNEYRIKALKHLDAVKSFADLESRIPQGASKRSLVDVIFNADLFGVDLVKALDPVSRVTLDTAGTELLAEIGKDDPWKMPPAKALNYLGTRSHWLKRVGATAADQLQTALDEGKSAGDTMDQLADRVRGVFNNLGKFEARRIAMTETASAYGFARHEAMTSAGIEFKAWLSSHGPNVREAHALAEEVTRDNPVPVDEPFDVDGESLMYPVDPSGSPGNIINCQCVQIAVQKPEGEES